jgi:hypothetical protein
MQLGKSFLASDTGGVLAGPLVQLAAGGKPSLEGLADPAHLFHQPSPAPAVTAPISAPSTASVNPDLAPFAAANNDADEKQRERLQAQQAATVSSRATSDTILSDANSPLSRYG